MKLLKTTLAVLAVLALPSLGLSPRLHAEDVDVAALYKKAVKSCVFIIVVSEKSYSMGSGSLIDLEKRIVLTNYHVVDDKDVALVQFPIYLKSGEIMTDKEVYIANAKANKAIKGKVLARDKTRDLAFIQLEKVPTGTPVMTLAKQSIGVGATTWNIGSPGDVAQVFSITEGKVRAVGPQRFLVGGGGGVFEVNAKVVTTTNPANPGDSGGPLIDKRGYQVAVTQSGNTRVQLVSNFIDVTEVRAYLTEKKIAIKELSTEPDPKVDSKLVAVPKKDDEPKTETPVPKKETGSTATPEQEKQATELLRRSKLFATGDDNRPTYLEKLQEIIKKYPATAGAKEAKKLIDNLK